MNKGIKIIIGIVIAFLILYLIGSRNQPKYETNSPAYSNNEFKQAFIEGCIEEDATYEYCNCAYEYLVDTHGEDRVIDISVEYAKTNVIPDELWGAVKHCMKYY